MTMSEQNKKLVRELVESVYGGELTRLDDFVSDAYVDHSRWGDREGLRRMLAQFKAAYPDIEFTVEDIVAEGNRVAARIRATYTGSPKRREREKTIRATAIFRIDEGKVVEHWGTAIRSTSARLVLDSPSLRLSS